ncbi:MAG: hypothetical protein WCG47_34155, partial [Dermatophilaceae bacterium]
MPSTAPTRPSTPKRRWPQLASRTEASGVTQRSASVQTQLAPQDGLYGVLESAPERTRLRLVGAIREMVYPAVEQARLDALFDDAAVAVVTLTVTEKGYRATAPDGWTSPTPSSPPTWLVARSRFPQLAGMQCGVVPRRAGQRRRRAARSVLNAPRS